ncbi:MAG: glycosyltransferase family 9 protein [Capsulimonas sp.]
MRKILVVNMNYLGDALLTTPAMAAMRRAYPDAQIDTIVGSGAAAGVLAGNPDIDRIIPRTARDSWGRCKQLFQTLRRGKYTDVVILPPLPAYAVTAFLAGTPVRVGQANRGMNRFLTDLRHTNAVHMADAMLDTVHVPNEARPTRRGLTVTVDPQAVIETDQLLSDMGIDLSRDLVAVNVGATRPQKRWMAENFAAVLDQLADHQLVLIGAGPEDEALTADVLGQVRSAKPVNLISRTTIPQLAALLRRSRVLLSADSGPMHLATAVGAPVVALFGSTDPKITGPYDEASQSIYKALHCAPCGNHPTCEGRFDCMRAITPDEAALAVRSLLRRDNPMRSLPLAARPHAGLASRTSNPPAKPILDGPPKHILIVTKFRFIGDTLLAIPVFRAARRRWPDARIVLLTGRNARMLLKNNPYLDEIIEFDPNKRDHGQRAFWRFVKRVHRGHFDLCLILNRSFHSALLTWFAGSRGRAGFDCEGRGPLLSQRVPYDREKSEIACYFDVLRSVAPETEINSELELWINPDERAEAEKRLADALGWGWAGLRLIGVQPGASLPGKRWSPANFASVANTLASSDPNARVVLVGGPDEQASADAMLAGCTEETRRRTVSFVGKCDLRGSLALIEQLGLFIGNDTAVMHSAVALGVPTVALFGPTNPRKWGNYGERRSVIESTNGKMDGIAVEPVVAAARSLLEASSLAK